MQWLTLEQLKQRFQVKDNRTIIKFIRHGLKCIKIGTQYRFNLKDIEDFEQKLKDEQQEKIIEVYPIKKKTKTKTLNIDYEKMRINRELNRVV